MSGGGGGGGGGLSKLGITLVVIFAISLLALFAQLFYALWRRRVFRRQASTLGGGGDEELSTSSSVASSKELLYFFCIRPQFRIDRDRSTANSGAKDLNSSRETDVEVIDVDLLKIQGMFGPPRFLFTIKEEEREDLEPPANVITICPSAEEEAKKKIGDENGGSVRLEEYLRSAEDAVVVVDIDDHGGVDDATPFSTPCASPLYVTPSTSPVHDVVNGRSK